MLGKRRVWRQADRSENSRASTAGKSNCSTSPTRWRRRGIVWHQLGVGLFDDGHTALRACSDDSKVVAILTGSTEVIPRKI